MEFAFIIATIRATTTATTFAIPPPLKKHDNNVATIFAILWKNNQIKDHENNHIATHITTNANNDNYKNGDENEDNVAMTSLVTIKAAATTN